MKKISIVVVTVISILLICLAVSSILATLTYIGVQTAQKKFRETVKINDLRNVVTSLEEYYVKYGKYPILTDSSLLTSIEKVKGKNEVTFNYPYIKLLDPITGTDSEFSTKLSEPGVMIYTGTGNDKSIKCVPQGKTDGNTLGSSIDKWQIFYSTNGNAPQRYNLFACTESGLSTNFGVNTDD